MTAINGKLTMFPSPYNQYLESARSPVYETPESGLAAVAKHSERTQQIQSKVKTDNEKVSQMQDEYYKTIEMNKNQAVSHSMNKQVSSIGLREYIRATNNYDPPNIPNMGGLFNGIA